MSDNFNSWIPPMPAFNKFIIGSSTIKAGNTYSNITLTGGSGIGLSADTTHHIITISAAIPSLGVVNNTSYINQTSNIATTIYHVTSDGVFRISIYQINTQSALAGTLSTALSWTDNTGSQTQTPAANISVTLLNTFSNGQSYIHAKAGSYISISTSLSGVTGSPKYSLFVTIEKLS